LNTTVTVIVTIASLVLLLLIWGVRTSNKLVRRRNQADNAFAGVGAYLKKRYDLIPNLVAAAQEYMGHEKEVLTEVTALRSAAEKPNLTSEEQIALGNKMNGALRSFQVAVENYPQLKADTHIMQLQASLNEVEEQLSAARRTYNSAAMKYNNGVQLFPSNIIAGIAGFRPKSYLDAVDAERVNVDVKNLFNR
jgi:LemA protein